ncbi:MAG: hypothetical protein VKJ09_07190 [Leptolyngbya sp.]|nr:hypothetical protein [Leptolyngbya sp.]
MDPLSSMPATAPVQPAVSSRPKPPGRSRPFSRPWLWGGLACAGVVALSGCTGLSLPGGAPGQPSYEQQLAEHLTASGAQMYGAFWCPHGSAQKELFGNAVDQVPYVECDPEGEAAQPQLCQEKGIQGYPTWEINGELYPGVRSLEELAELSDYPAPQ